MADNTAPSGSSQKLWQKLLAGVQSAVELRVVTLVGNVKVTGDIGKPSVSFPPNQTNAIATSINLVEGDVTNVVPEQFWAPDKEVVRQFHQSQVAQSNAIVERNLKLIGELGSSLAKAIGELKSLESQS